MKYYSGAATIKW